MAYTEEKNDEIIDDKRASDDKKFDELKALVGGITRARFRVRPDYSSDMFGIMLFLMIITCAGSVLLNISINIKNSTVGVIIVAVIMIVVVVIAVAVMISYTVKSKRIYYCYYFNTERGAIALSLIDETATVFYGGVAYRMERDKFYSLDEEGFRLWLDGECTGLYSILNCSRDDFEILADDLYFVANKKGGGHEIHLDESGNIKSITSAQPFSSDVVDVKTGEAKIKTRKFVKTEMTTEFDFAVPEFIVRAFEGARATLPDLRGL